MSDAGRISVSDIASDKELRRIYRDLGARSLYFLTKGILGYDLLTKRTHLEFCKFLQDYRTKKTLDLMPRGVYKTTCGTIGWTIKYLINFPNNSVLVSNQTSYNVEAMVMEMEGHLDGGNPLMNWLYPEMIKPNDRWKPWSKSEFMIPCKGGPQRPSVVGAGVGTRLESWHFHAQVKDDLIGRLAMLFQREMLNAISWDDYASSLFVSPKTGIERMHGTRWSLDDLYALKLQDPEYAVFYRQAIDPETGLPFFPEILDLETLRKIREKNYAHYMSQYMNDPENPEVLDFRSAWLNFYNLIKTEKGPACEADGHLFYVSDMDVILVVDPAASGDVDNRFIEDLKRGRARKSNNAVGVVGLHGSGRFFLLDLWVGRGRGQNPELQVAEQMMNMARRWHGYLRRGFVEAFGAQRTLITVYNMLCRDNNFHFLIDEIPRGNQRAKPVRIRGAIGGPAQNGQLYCRRHHDTFIYEFSKFPQLRDQQDTLDMFAWAVLLLNRPFSDAVRITLREKATKRRQRRLRVIGRGGY